MVKKEFVPLRGDIVWLDFSPTRGHEQDKIRPALVITDGVYNNSTGLALVCPITSKKRGHNFEVELRGLKVKGVVVSNQVRNVSWVARDCRYIDKADNNILNEVCAKIKSLLFSFNE